MRIKVAEIEPNPYRKIDEYPIDRHKVDALKQSIEEKTFWDNILVRPHPSKKDKYQLAYGHHRWIALKELKIKEVDIAVRRLDDATMVKIMAEENLNWSTAPSVMVQTIASTKEFLDKELRKGWQDSQDFLRVLFDSKHALEQAMRNPDGIGEPTLKKFLGGNWTTHVIRTALVILHDKDLDKKAINEIPTVTQARVFRESVKKHDIPKAVQHKIAKKIKDDGIGRRDIPDFVAGHSLKPVVKTEPKPLPSLDSYVNQTTKQMYELTQRLNHIGEHIENVLSESIYCEFNLHVVDLTTKLNAVLRGLKNVQEKKAKNCR